MVYEFGGMNEWRYDSELLNLTRNAPVQRHTLSERRVDEFGGMNDSEWPGRYELLNLTRNAPVCMNLEV